MHKRLMTTALVVLLILPMAAADQYLHGSTQAESVQLVEQHTVYAEIVSENLRRQNQREQIAVVVGLLKICRKEVRVFDNAVLWFNDQFLFGDKRRVVDNGTGLGRDTDNKTKRFIGCIVPHGFMVVVDAEAPVSSREELEALFELERQCDCAVVRYDTSYYITDPNGAQWVADAYTLPLPLSALDETASGEPPIGAFTGAVRSRGTFPIVVVHLQVGPDREPIRDEAPWRWPDTGQVRLGTPRFEDFDDEANETIDPQHECRMDLRCNMEYDFLLPVEFGMFDTSGPQKVHGNPATTDESKAGNAHPHNPTSAQDTGGVCPADDHAQHQWGEHRCATDVGGSPNATDRHRHETRTVNLFFVERGPKHLEDNPYWDAFGAPPVLASGEDCDDHPVLSSRSFDICDTVADSGFHLHDGSQTPFP